MTHPSSSVVVDPSPEEIARPAPRSPAAVVSKSVTSEHAEEGEGVALTLGLSGGVMAGVIRVVVAVAVVDAFFPSENDEEDVVGDAEGGGFGGDAERGAGEGQTGDSATSCTMASKFSLSSWLSSEFFWEAVSMAWHNSDC